MRFHVRFTVKYVAERMFDLHFLHKEIRIQIVYNLFLDTWFIYPLLFCHYYLY